jgi:hypothetical protein
MHSTLSSDSVVLASFYLAATIGPEASREKAAGSNCAITAEMAPIRFLLARFPSPSFC